MLQIAIAQLNLEVGAFESNFEKINEAYERACSLGARLLLTPELSVPGYPPNDLVQRPEMFEKNGRVIQNLMKKTLGKKCALAVGHMIRNPSNVGRIAQNVVSILDQGKCVFQQAKTLLPSYDVFNEDRYFEPAEDIGVWTCDGYKIAIAICEDLWADDPPPTERGEYRLNPVKKYQELGADVICSLSASPYYQGKFERRKSIHQKIAKNLKVPVVYVNWVGATDDVLFDGGSFVADSELKSPLRLPFFEPAFGMVSIDKKTRTTLPSDALSDATFNEMEILAQGLVVGIREYFAKSGFKKALLGLSGGIDSAVVAALAAKALGPENVLGVAMPSQYSSSHSLEDATLVAQNLKMAFDVRPIKFLYSMASRELSEKRGELNPLALENLQARLRGLILMTWSNHDQALVLTPGNKSELAMGYCTVYGDMVGALAPIGDLYKTQVYQLSEMINHRWGNPIPARSISKPPSAELRPNQTDQEILPPYEILDGILEAYLEKGLTLSEITLQFADQPLGKLGSVAEIIRRLEMNEYKRKQAAPVLKVSAKAFGSGRRMVIGSHFTIDTYSC